MKHPRSVLLGVLACALPLLPCAARAEAVEGLDTTISLRGDVWSSSRELDDTDGIAQLSAWGAATFDLGAGGKVVGSGWVRAQTPGQPRSTQARLRELYWRYTAGQVTVKLGRQMAAWGRADGINPTDNLSPRALTLLVPDDGDQRYGNEAAQVAVDTAAGSVSAWWFARAASHTIPLTAVPNLRYAVATPRQSQWAVKWEGGANGLDGSLSYFNGVDPMPDLVFAGIDAAGVTVAVRNGAARILGADVSVSSGKIIWRAEAAWLRTDSLGGADFAHKKDQVFIVGGGELSLNDTTTVGAQALFQRVPDYTSPDTIAAPLLREIAWRQAASSNQVARQQHGMTMRLASRWLNDSLSAELSGVVLWPGTGGNRGSNGLWRTRLVYALDDHWTVQAGSDRYFGAQRSYFGQLDNNRLLYLQLRYSM